MKFLQISSFEYRKVETNGFWVRDTHVRSPYANLLSRFRPVIRTLNGWAFSKSYFIDIPFLTQSIGLNRKNYRENAKFSQSFSKFSQKMQVHLHTFETLHIDVEESGVVNRWKHWIFVWEKAFQGATHKMRLTEFLQFSIEDVWYIRI